VPDSRIYVRVDLFSAREVNVRNALYDEIGNASSISSFNSELLTMDLSSALHRINGVSISSSIHCISLGIVFDVLIRSTMLRGNFIFIIRV
jgi:hypothetical protein